MYKGRTFIISGPSGVGKSTVLKELFKDREDLYFSVSATTREPRPGEVDGVHYHFTDVDEFRKMISEDAFLEYAAPYIQYHQKGRLNPFHWMYFSVC